MIKHQRNKHEPAALELLAPAGDWAHFHSAVNAGADAVYVGVDGFNMRANARNFSVADLGRLAREAHDAGVLLYLALNILCYEHDLEELALLLDQVKLAGVDAVIASDLAVIDMCWEREIAVHISTQQSLSNSRAVGFFFERGVRRFVLARECSLEDVVAIRSQLSLRYGERAQELELEAFVHGAMCVSVSGRCFMSGFESGKSANRGECRQACRREYVLTDRKGEEAFRLDEGYLLSPKDLCVLPFIEKLIDAGIHSFKIEGRNRSADYVHTVVSVYRQCIDFYLKERRREDFELEFNRLKGEGMHQLKGVYNRGFSEGFYFGKPMGEWTSPSGNQADYKRQYLGKVLHYYDRIGVAEVQLEAGDMSLGQEIFFEGERTGVVVTCVESMQVEHATVTSATKGMRVGMKTPEPVRPNDKLYLRVSMEGERNCCDKSESFISAD